MGLLQFIKKKAKKDRILNIINLYIFIGDSNCEGVADVPNPAYNGPISDGIIFYKPTITATDNGTWPAFQQGVNNVPGTANNSYYSSINSFMFNLAQISTVIVGALKLGKGGSTLVNTAPDNWASATAGNYWAIFRDYFVSVALQKLVALGYNPTIKGAWIRLGTNDVSVSFYDLPQWKSQIQAMVLNLRTLARNPNLPIYWYLVRTDRPSLAANITAVNQALTDCTTQGNAAYIANFYTINIDGPPSDLIDSVHFTTAAYDAQGLNQANQAIALGE